MSHQDLAVFSKCGACNDNVSSLLSDLSAGEEVEQGESDSYDDNDGAHDGDG